MKTANMPGKSFFLSPRRASLLLASLLCLAVPGLARDAAAAQEDTVLYYLIEMQRRVHKNCQGRAMSAAPSLTPSETLRDLALESLNSGRPAEVLAAEAGLSGAPLTALSGVGNTARQVFDSLMAGQCPALMGQEHHRIGAAGKGGRWTVILAASDTGVSARAGAGAGAGLGAGAAPPAGGSTQGGQSPVEGQSGVEARPVPSGWIDGGEVRYPASRQAEAAPAPAVPVGEMRLDATGRPVGRVLPVETPPIEMPDASGPDAFGPDISGAPDASGQDGDASMGGSATGFSPPAAPGPFGARTQAQQNSQPRAGVTPLSDSRPPMEENLVYRAPGVEPEDGAEIPSAYTQAPGASGLPASGASEMSASGAAGMPGSGQAGMPGAATIDPSLAGQAPMPPARVVGTAPVRVAPVAPANLEAQDGPMLALINAERMRGGLCGSRRMPPAPPLSLNASLKSAAMAHAADMAARGYFASTSPGGPDLGARVSAAGYTWSQVAENLASGPSTPQDAVMGWLAVPAQCKNLLDAELTEAGLGRDPSGRYWVLTLASPAHGDEGVIRLEREPR